MRVLLALICGLLGSSAEASTSFRVVYVSPAPILIEFQISVDGVSIAETRRQAAGVLVRSLDTDHNGQLSREEAASLDPLPGETGATVESLWSAVDVAPDDDALSVDEVHALIDAALGSPVNMVQVARSPLSDTTLESFLDANNDGIISVDEFDAGFHQLRRADFDDDNTLSAAEIAALAKSADNDSDRNTPFYAADDTALATLLESIATGDAASSLQRRRWSELDADDDSTIDATEVTAWLTEAPADFVVRIDLATINGNRLKVDPGQGRVRLTRPERSRSRTRGSVKTESAKIDLRVTNSGFSVSDSKNFLKLQHLVSDTDQNGYLSPGEYNGFENQPGPFEAIDADGNGMMYVAELEQYLDDRQKMAQLQVKIDFENVSRTLFQQLDLDGDNRLAPREVLTQSGNEKSADSSGSAYRIIASTDFISFLRNTEQPMAAQARPRVRETSEGPRWFRNMDRNKDGDLIWREFLGPREAFDKLDRDNDGFITPDEAELATSDAT